MSEAPTEPGGFVGDIYYGDPERTTFGTHRWNGSEWIALASEAEALTMLLGSARARIAELTRQLADVSVRFDQQLQLAGEENARVTRQLAEARAVIRQIRQAALPVYGDKTDAKTVETIARLADDYLKGTP